jgi:subtilisin family serine protease
MGRWVLHGSLGGAAVLASIGVFASPAPVGATPYEVATEQLVVQLSAAAEAHPASVLGLLPGPVPEWLPGQRWSTDLPTTEAAYVRSELSSVSGVNYVSPVQPVHAAGVVPNNPCYDATCGPTQPVVVEDPQLGAGATIVHPNGQSDMWAVNAAQAWGTTKGSSHVLVAVLDTGVDPEQVQLETKVIVGQDVCTEDPLCASPYDNNGHGTFVTGLIGAETNDGTGIAGLGWNTPVIDIKVLDDDGNGNTMDEATGIYDAVLDGARVINLSLTSDPCSMKPSACGPNPDEEGAVEYAIAHGVVVVAAAGNYNSDAPVYPAAYPGVLSVAASTDQGVVDPLNGGEYLDFSEYGDAANIAAPGIDVLSTWYDGNYSVGSGTSFAAPLVAAAAALVMAADPSLTGPQVATLLRQTVLPLAPGGNAIEGGLLDVGAAVQAAAEHQVPRALDGYQLVGSDGNEYNSGAVAAEGSMFGRHLAHRVVGAVEAPGGLGYWLVSSDGGVFAFGPGAHFYGSKANSHLREPIVGIATTPSGRGYWLVAENGAIYTFGDARIYGHPGSVPPAESIVAMAPTPDGRGYWLVAAGGAVFAFGDAHYYGSVTKLQHGRPIVGMAATVDGHGYWLVSGNGSIFSFGDAVFYGSAAGQKPARAIVGMEVSPEGNGYWLASSQGHVYSFGSAPYAVPEPIAAPGLARANPPSEPIVAISS